MKKVYTIEITGASRAGIWYGNKIGKRFLAELVCRAYYADKNYGIVVFEVNPCQFVQLIDCKVVSERTVEKYYKEY